MTDKVLAQLNALKTTPTPKLREQWRQLFDSEPPPFNRQYIESRLAYQCFEFALRTSVIRAPERYSERSCEIFLRQLYQ